MASNKFVEAKLETREDYTMDNPTNISSYRIAVKHKSIRYRPDEIIVQPENCKKLKYKIKRDFYFNYLDRLNCVNTIPDRYDVYYRVETDEQAKSLVPNLLEIRGYIYNVVKNDTLKNKCIDINSFNDAINDGILNKKRSLNEKTINEDASSSDLAKKWFNLPQDFKKSDCASQRQQVNLFFKLLFAFSSGRIDLLTNDMIEDGILDLTKELQAFEQISATYMLFNKINSNDNIRVFDYITQQLKGD